MKRYFPGVAALGLGLVIGGFAMPGVRAQATAPVYYQVTEMEVTDEAAYDKSYAPLIRASVVAAGGRVLASSNKPVGLEGDKPKTRIAVLAWDSIDKISAWRASDAFKAARAEGDKVAKFRSYAVPGLAP